MKVSEDESYKILEPYLDSKLELCEGSEPESWEDFEAYFCKDSDPESYETFVAKSTKIYWSKILKGLWSSNLKCAEPESCEDVKLILDEDAEP